MISGGRQLTVARRGTPWDAFVAVNGSRSETGVVREREAPSAAEAIAESLRQQIIDELADGDHIGSAEDLAIRFRVSNPTIRQAMRVLEAEGLVRVRRGNNGGFFASSPSIHVVSRSASALLRRQGAELADLVSVSKLIGPEVAMLAAANPDKAARQNLLAYVDETWPDDGSVTLETAVTASVKVGRVLGELSGSPSLALVSAVLSDLVIVLVEPVTAATPPEVLHEYANKIREGHRRLALAIGKGDIVAARRAQERMNLIVDL
jgi:GntR family transcriptional repressor for pyruvate dehydrogenase complex